MMLTSLSLVAPEVAVSTAGTTNDDKVVIVTIPGFNVYSHSLDETPYLDTVLYSTVLYRVNNTIYSACNGISSWPTLCLFHQHVCTPRQIKHVVH